MGKRQLGQMQPFEFVIALIIADLATVPMADKNIPLVSGIIPLIILLISHFGLSFLSRKSIKVRRILNGGPVIVVNENGIDYEALASLNMNINDLQEGLRTNNYFDIEQVAYVIVETNGTITVLPKANYSPVCCEDIGITDKHNELPYLVICDGKVLSENLNILKTDISVIEKIKKISGCDDLKRIIFASLNLEGKLYIQVKDEKYISTKINLGE